MHKLTIPWSGRPFGSSDPHAFLDAPGHVPALPPGDLPGLPTRSIPRHHPNDAHDAPPSATVATSTAEPSTLLPAKGSDVRAATAVASRPPSTVTLRDEWASSVLLFSLFLLVAFLALSVGGIVLGGWLIDRRRIRRFDTSADPGIDLHSRRHIPVRPVPRLARHASGPIGPECGKIWMRRSREHLDK